jgi:hypothetical protein
MKLIKNFLYHFFNFFLVSLLKIHWSNYCNDHYNKIIVLLQLATLSVLFKFSGTKEKLTA